MANKKNSKHFLKNDKKNKKEIKIRWMEKLYIKMAKSNIKLLIKDVQFTKNTPFGHWVLMNRLKASRKRYH